MRLVKDPTVFYPFEQHDSFRWKCHPVQYKFVLEGVTFPAEIVIQ